MPKSIDSICQKYELKLRTGKMPIRVDSDPARQIEAFRRATVSNEAMRSAVATVINREGVCSIWWVGFYAYSRKLAWLRAHIGSPEVLRSEARMQLEVWAARGLARTVLEKVALECFELDLTGPIPTLAQPPERT
jgi:hypothetical protein